MNLENLKMTDRKGSRNLTQVGDLLNEGDSQRVCSMSGSIYDTAWVSMVSRPVSDQSKWLFPESFQFICDAQSNSGGWEGGDIVDEIVNSLACLVSLKMHSKVDSGLEAKIEKATQFLTSRLSVWEVSTTERVAFEIIIPSMLNLLALEGIHLQFPDYEMLRQLNHAKMSKIDLSLIHEHPSTILHSLEAFIGKVDFDKLSHHLNGGSMMASPSSTAAYIMNTSTWDKSAEKYLSDAVQNGRRVGGGAVTDVFPINTFEFAWVPALPDGS
jgi:hypothetical protein